MGRLSGGGFFARQGRQQQQAAGAQQEQAQASFLADAAFDQAAIQTPVEQLQAEQPVLQTQQPQGVIDPATVGPDPSELYPAQLRSQPEVIGTSDQLAGLQQQEHLVQTPQGLQPADPSQIQGLYQQQLQDEAGQRLAAIPDVEGQLKAVGAGTPEEAVGKFIESSAGAFRFDAGNERLFGVAIQAKPDIDATPYERAISSDPQGYITRNAGAIQKIVKGNNKLNMLTDPRDPRSEVRPELGKAVGLSILTEVLDRAELQANESDKPVSQREFDNALDRQNIGPAVGKKTERLLYPTATQEGQTDPMADLFGETTDFGYNYRLDPKEQSILGQSSVQFFADSPHYNWLESKTLTDPATGKQKISYNLTEEGFKEATKLRRGMRSILGQGTHDRPVSLVKPDVGGRLRGEGAYTQKETTRKLLPSGTPKVVQDAKDRLSSVPHVVSPHKALIMGGIFAQGAIDPTSNIAKYAKQDTNYANTKANEISANLKEQEKKGFVTLQERALALGLDPNTANWQQVGQAEAGRILSLQQQSRQRNLDDAVARLGDVFYYGYTAVNNSSRLMISNTELNYQANKHARFMVDGATPEAVTKGSGSKQETGFLTVVGRSLIKGADKMPRDQIRSEMRAAIKNGTFNNAANDIVNYTQSNIGWLTQAKGAIDQGQEVPPAPPFTSPAIEQVFAEYDRDEVPWAIDALHELGRYNNLSDGATFTTRVKAEADGIQKGAVIQGYQMGEADILQRGGVLFEGDKVEIPQDLREHVWETSKNVVLSKMPEERRQVWTDTVNLIQDRGKIKAATKIPMMTTIYGKESRFHRDTAEQFAKDNPDILLEFSQGTDLEAAEAREVFVSDMTNLLQFSLDEALGGVLEHSNILKRVGRAFNIANRIAEVEGANGWTIQAGGWEMVDDPEGLTRVPAGPGTDRKYAEIATKKRVPSAAAAASPKAKPGQPGVKTTPRPGSKLTNQLKVNGTQNIDATVAQETINAIPQNDYVMQIYDAFIGDSNSYIDLVDTANKKFDEVNNRFSMLKAERDAFQKLNNDVVKRVADAKKNKEKIDIGHDGDFPLMTYFFDNLQTIINADLNGNEARVKLKNYNNLKYKAQALGYKFEAPMNEIDPDNFLKLYRFAIGPELLDVDNQLSQLIRDVGTKRKAIRQKKQDQRKRLGIETGLQYG